MMDIGKTNGVNGRKRIVLCLAIGLATGLALPGDNAAAAQAPVALRSAGNFAVLAGATVTSTGGTRVNGDLGVWPGTAVVGFAGIVPGGPGTVNGTIHAGDAVAQTAQGDLTTAYNDAAGRSLDAVIVANADLGGRTLAPGLYKSSGTLAITGNLTLDGQGDPNAIFIFQAASSLNTAAGSQVLLSGEAKAANVFWQVGASATPSSLPTPISAAEPWPLVSINRLAHWRSPAILLWMDRVIRTPSSFSRRLPRSTPLPAARCCSVAKRRPRMFSGRWALPRRRHRCQRRSRRPNPGPWSQ